MNEVKNFGNNIEKKNNGAEDFFKNVKVEKLQSEEFFNIIRKRYPKSDEDTILRCKAMNFLEDGKNVIIIRSDIFPEEYIPYVETHEKWESYVSRKKGVNLFEISAEEFVRDKNIETDNLTEKELEEVNDIYRDNIESRKYAFKHEYAVYKEYQQALKDGKLDEYHRWIMGLLEDEQKEVIKTNNTKKLEISKNDIRIRESIYKKLKTGEKHYFSRE